MAQNYELSNKKIPPLTTVEITHQEHLTALDSPLVFIWWQWAAAQVQWNVIWTGPHAF